MNPEEELARIKAAIKEHHDQKADDRCIEDDAKLYAAAGLPPHDCRVGNKGEMLKNCLRFIENRCAEGGWPTYAELEQKIQKLEGQLHRLLFAANIVFLPKIRNNTNLLRTVVREIEAEAQKRPAQNLQEVGKGGNPS